MNKLFIALLSVSAVASLAAKKVELKHEDQSHLAQLRAEIKEKETQVDRLHKEIERDREALARAESEAHVRAASAEQKTFGCPAEE